jgi:Cof subfamily protein (haloacid dehalogenase superfamily)
MAHRPYLYLSDLDGTLLNARGKLSARTKAGLLKLLEDDVPFSIASARSHFSISQIFGEMPFSLPIIEFNGAFITDYKTGEHLETNALPTDTAQELFDLIREHGQTPFVSTHDGRGDRVHFDELKNEAMAWYEQQRRRASDPRLRQTSDLRQVLSEEVVSFTVMDSREESVRSLRAAIVERFGDSLRHYCYENAYCRGTFWLTIHDRRASKHIAMESLRKRLGDSAQIVAFGDNVNDIDMLKAANRAVAVENAIPELRAVAHDVIGHHETDSVIRFLLAENLRKSA